MSHNLALNWLYSLIVKVESEEIVVTEETMEALETVDTVETVENAYFPTLCPSYMQTPSNYILQLLAEYFQYKYIKSTSIYIPNSWQYIHISNPVPISFGPLSDIYPQIVGTIFPIQY